MGDEFPHLIFIVNLTVLLKHFFCNYTVLHLQRYWADFFRPRRQKWYFITVDLSFSHLEDISHI
jgi:hypothetical protein